MTKNQIQKILVGLDGSKNSFRALAKAIVLAKQTKASITGIFVIPTFPTEMGLVPTHVGNSLGKKCKNVMSMAKSKCMKQNLEFLDTVEYGNEGSTIVSFAKKNNYDMIVIGSRGMGIIKEIFLGSTSNYVIHKSKIPVLIVK